MKIVRVEQIDWLFDSFNRYAEMYHGNIVIEQKDSLSVPFVYIFQNDGATFWAFNSTTGVALVNLIETLEKNCYEGAKALAELQEREGVLNNQVMMGNEKIEQFATALNEKNIQLKDADVVIAERDRQLKEATDYTHRLVKTLDAIGEPELEPGPTVGDSGPEARARALLILREKFTAAEITYMQQFGVPIF